MTRAKADSEIIENPDGAPRGPEQALVDAMLGCLGSADACGDSPAKRRQAGLVDRLRAHAEAHADEAVFLSDACATVLHGSPRLLDRYHQDINALDFCRKAIRFRLTQD